MTDIVSKKLPRTASAPPSLLRGVITYTVHALTGAYALSLIGVLVLRLTIGEALNLLGLFYSILHLLVIPAPFLLLVMLIAREWRLVLLLSAGTIAFMTWYAPDWLPKSPPAWATAGDTPQVTLMSYNVRSFAQNQLDGVVRVVGDADADIVALQEISPPGAERMDAEFSERFPYRVWDPYPQQWTAGQGVMSRYPILESEFWKRQQGFQRLLIDVDGQQIAIYNVHAAYPIVEHGTRLRHDDIVDLLARAEAETVPVILLGDFNMTPLNIDYGLLVDHFTDAHRAIGSGPGWTFTYNKLNMQQFGRLVRIDYLFYEADHFAALEAASLPDAGGSDHAPLRVRLALRP